MKFPENFWLVEVHQVNREKTMSVLVTKSITLVILMQKKGEFSFISKPNLILSIRKMIGLLESLRPGNDQPDK